jgi:hypothetical protein
MVTPMIYVFFNIFLLPNFIEKYILTLKMYRLNNDCHFQQEIFVKFEKKLYFSCLKKRKIRLFFLCELFFLDLGMKKGRE